MVLNHKPVPTVQKPHRLAPTTVTTVTCSSTVGVASVSTASSTVTQVTTAVTAPICSAIVAPKQSVRVRGAFAKREHQRILEDALAVGPCECDVKPKPSDHHTADLSGSCDGASETDKPSPVYASTQTETHRRIKRNKKIQVTPKAAQKRQS
ncbi:uncharacterized protein [Littorina saxatilis]|uniref:uncharacterized protein n=1 Tax=Littorina saxatilis TaxID=31220 RepID=UPI0038B5FD72